MHRTVSVTPATNAAANPTTPTSLTVNHTSAAVISKPTERLFATLKVTLNRDWKKDDSVASSISYGQLRKQALYAAMDILQKAGCKRVKVKTIQISRSTPTAFTQKRKYKVVIFIKLYLSTTNSSDELQMGIDRVIFSRRSRFANKLNVNSVELTISSKTQDDKPLAEIPEVQLQFALTLLIKTPWSENFTDPLTNEYKDLKEEVVSMVSEMMTLVNVSTASMNVKSVTFKKRARIQPRTDVGVEFDELIDDDNTTVTNFTTSENTTSTVVTAVSNTSTSYITVVNVKYLVKTSQLDSAVKRSVISIAKTKRSPLARKIGVLGVKIRCQDKWKVVNGIPKRIKARLRMKMKLKLKRKWSDDLSDKTSKAYKDLSEKVLSATTDIIAKSGESVEEMDTVEFRRVSIAVKRSLSFGVGRSSSEEVLAEVNTTVQTTKSDDMLMSAVSDVIDSGNSSAAANLGVSTVDSAVEDRLEFEEDIEKVEDESVNVAVFAAEDDEDGNKEVGNPKLENEKQPDSGLSKAAIAGIICALVVVVVATVVIWRKKAE